MLPPPISMRDATALTASFAPSFLSATTSTMPSMMILDSTPFAPFIVLMTAPLSTFDACALTVTVPPSPLWIYTSPPPFAKIAAVCPLPVASKVISPGLLISTTPLLIAEMPVLWLEE